MTDIRQGRYSIFIKPLSYLIDLIIINALIYWFFSKQNNLLEMMVTVSLSWVLIATFSRFYNVYRYTKGVSVVSFIVRQFFFFTIAIYALLGFFKTLNVPHLIVFKFISLALITVTVVKLSMFFLLKTYRGAYGKNFRTTVIFGKNSKTKDLEHFFNEHKEYGYNHKKTFNIKLDDANINSYFKYILDEKVDEIYCSLSALTNKQLNQVIDFADNNLKILRFIPDNKDIYTKRLDYQYYNFIPILSFRSIPLEKHVNQIVKRVFDILFSSAVIVFLLSWLTPIIAILIKLESKGPVFFKQSRNGFNYKEFDCYKFRSMTPNDSAHVHQATRGDHRVTKVGAFIRKTSIDELPQFFNVLFGDMSVVGPRPHMVSHTNMYAKKVDKFMVRHFVKPGITGLAQIKGFRGEIETDQDIINRVKYDIFYIENWSLILDLRITIQTFLNAVKGEEKAY